MTYSVARRADEAGICTFCGAPTVRMAVEQVEEMAYIPMWRTSRMVAQCARCVRTFTTRLDPRLAAKLELPKSPRIMSRIVTTWLIMGLLAVSIAGLWLRAHLRKIERAANPEVGDTWTVDLEHWVVQTDTLGGEFAESVANGMSHGRVRVTRVDAEHVEVAGCELASDKSETVEDRCTVFNHQLAPLARSRVPSLLDAGAIERIDRGATSYIGVIIVALSFTLLMWIHGWRSRSFFDSIAASHTAST